MQLSKRVVSGVLVMALVVGSAGLANENLNPFSSTQITASAANIKTDEFPDIISGNITGFLDRYGHIHSMEEYLARDIFLYPLKTYPLVTPDTRYMNSDTVSVTAKQDKVGQCVKLSVKSGSNQTYKRWHVFRKNTLQKGSKWEFVTEYAHYGSSTEIEVSTHSYQQYTYKVFGVNAWDMDNGKYYGSKAKESGKVNTQADGIRFIRVKNPGVELQLCTSDIDDLSNLKLYRTKLQNLNTGKVYTFDKKKSEVISANGPAVNQIISINSSLPKGKYRVWVVPVLKDNSVGTASWTEVFNYT